MIQYEVLMELIWGFQVGIDRMTPEDKDSEFIWAIVINLGILRILLVKSKE